MHVHNVHVHVPGTMSDVQPFPVQMKVKYRTVLFSMSGIENLWYPPSRHRSLTDFGSHGLVLPAQTLVAIDYGSCYLRQNGLLGCAKVEECRVRQSGA